MFADATGKQITIGARVAVATSKYRGAGHTLRIGKVIELRVDNTNRERITIMYENPSLYSRWRRAQWFYDTSRMVIVT